MSSDPHQRVYSYLLRAQELISDMALSDQNFPERSLYESVEEAVRCAKTMGWHAGVIEDAFKDEEGAITDEGGVIHIHEEEEDEGNANSSWFSGNCAKCGFPVVVTQPDSDLFPAADYWWYCSNPKCKRHSPGTHTGDMERPEWVDGITATLDVVSDPPDEEIPVSGGSSCSRIDLEKMFGDFDRDRKLKKPFRLFYLVPKEGHLKSVTLFTWKETLRAWCNFSDGKWAGPAGVTIEVQLITMLMDCVGMFEN